VPYRYGLGSRPRNQKGWSSASNRATSPWSSLSHSSQSRSDRAHPTAVCVRLPARCFRGSYVSVTHRSQSQLCVSQSPHAPSTTPFVSSPSSWVVPAIGSSVRRADGSYSRMGTRLPPLGWYPSTAPPGLALRCRQTNESPSHRPQPGRARGSSLTTPETPHWTWGPGWSARVADWYQAARPELYSVGLVRAVPSSACAYTGRTGADNDDPLAAVSSSFQSTHSGGLDSPRHRARVAHLPTVVNTPASDSDKVSVDSGATRLAAGTGRTSQGTVAAGHGFCCPRRWGRAAARELAGEAARPAIPRYLSRRRSGITHVQENGGRARPRQPAFRGSSAALRPYG